MHRQRPDALAAEVAKAGRGAHVVVEATGGTGPWTCCRRWEWCRRVKNDERDVRDLADLLRLGRLAEAWIAPPEIRELREMVRFRAKPSKLRTGLKTQVHAVMAKNGVLPELGNMWGPGGAARVDGLELPDAYTNRLEVLRDLIAAYDREITSLDRDIRLALRDHRGYQAIQTITALTECSPRCSWPTSATSAGSAQPRHCARGRAAWPS